MSFSYKTNSLILKAFFIEKKYLLHVPIGVQLTRVNADYCIFRSLFNPLLLASIHYCYT